MNPLKSVNLKKDSEMQTPPTYYAIFYDVDKPKTYLFAMNKRIPESLYLNLCDDFFGKEVELRGYDDRIAHFTVVGHRTFQIFNNIDNTYFVVCDCVKVKQGEICPIITNGKLPYAEGLDK